MNACTAIPALAVARGAVPAVPAAATPPGQNAKIVWQGESIAFTGNRDRPGPNRVGLGFELYTMAVDGSDIVRMTNNRRPDIFPDWQHLP
jgi:hypothetical protein